MTYGFKVTSEGGELEVADSYGDIPDGTHEISGHAATSPADTSSVQITHRDTSGEVVAAAYHHHAESPE